MSKTRSVTAQMEEILEEYKAEVDEGVDASAKSVAQVCARMLRESSPKRPGRGDYAKSWGVKKLGPRNYVTRNAKHWQLTWLLENGHDVVNGKGDTGKRAPAIKHIKPVEEFGIKQFGERVRRIISK